jgi:cytochrome c oxidase subunit I
MAIIERPTDTPALAGGAAVVTPTSSYGYFRRPVQTTGWKSWAFTVDHKKIGIMYGVVAMLFFFVGGFEALLIRPSSPSPTAPSCRPTSTTRCSRCTAPPWCSCS